MTKYLLPTMLIALFLTTSQAQTGKWSLQLGIGAASEQNLGSKKSDMLPRWMALLK